MLTGTPLDLTPFGGLLAALGWLYWLLALALVLLALWWPKRWWVKLVSAAVVLCAGIYPVFVRPVEKRVEAANQEQERFKARLDAAMALFEQRCKTAGEKITRPVENVEGVVWMKWRDKIDVKDDFDQFKPSGIAGWNEVEVENKTITPIIELTEIDSREVGYFMERPISHTIGNYELSGVVDGLIASGFRSPKLPFFCLSEFKKEMSDSQPDGQALISMLVTQELNADGFPIYGCYITGRHWYFIVLKGLEYAISKSYSADDDGIFDIYRIMLSLKQTIYKRLKK